MYRPRTSTRASHQTRPKLAGPAHVTMKLSPGLPSLRTQALLPELLDIFRAAKRRFGCHIQHFSILSNHIHLIVWASDVEKATRSMQGLAIRIARRVNKLWKRKGKVFAERFFLRPLVRRPMQIRRALVYVLQNARKHGIPLPKGAIDRFSSGRWFRGWKGVALAQDPNPPVSDPGDMVFDTWKQLGRIGVDEVPPGKDSRIWNDPSWGVIT